MILSIYDLAREIAADPGEQTILRNIPIITHAEVTEITRWRQSEAKKAHWTIPTYRAKIAKTTSGKKRPKVAAAVKAAHADPVKHARMVAYQKSEAHKIETSQRMKKLWSNPAWVRRTNRNRRKLRLAKKAEKIHHLISTLSVDSPSSPV